MSELIQYRIKADGAAALVESIEHGVASGELAPGERLPSVRRLAAEVGLSPATVAAAVAELRRRGVVISEERRGVRIGPGPAVGARRPALPVPDGARDLSRGNPDPRLLPDLAAAARAAAAPSRLYGEAADLPGLASAAAERLRADGVPARDVTVLSGALDAIERALQAHLRPGDRVAVENPGYAPLHDLLRAQGLQLHAVEIDDRGMRPAALLTALGRGAAAVVITPRGQNPTGAALDAGRAAELRAVLSRFPATLVVEDDHLGPVAGAPLHCVTAGAQRWAHAHSVAKSLGPDLRLAVLAGDPLTVARVRGRMGCGPGWVSWILQAIVLHLWRDDGARELVAAAGERYAERRGALLGHLAAAGIAAHGASGMNVWLPVQDEAGVLAALLARGWVVAPGSPYRLDGAGQGIRITAATLTDSEAARLAGDVAAALDPAPSGRSG